MNEILITCFEPFGGDSFNASCAVAEHMPDEIGGYATEKLVLPVEFGRSAEITISEAKRIGASYVFCFGEARSRKTVCAELLAINLRYASIPDNAGRHPLDTPVYPGGREAYFTPFPARCFAAEVSAAGTPCALSYSAGAYVCNDLYYNLLMAFDGTGVKPLFIHVPRMESAEGYAAAAHAISSAITRIISRVAE